MTPVRAGKRSVQAVWQRNFSRRGLRIAGVGRDPVLGVHPMKKRTRCMDIDVLQADEALEHQLLARICDVRVVDEFTEPVRGRQEVREKLGMAQHHVERLADDAPSQSNEAFIARSRRGVGLIVAGRHPSSGGYGGHVIPGFQETCLPVVNDAENVQFGRPGIRSMLPRTPRHVEGAAFQDGKMAGTAHVTGVRSCCFAISSSSEPGGMQAETTRREVLQGAEVLALDGILPPRLLPFLALLRCLLHSCHSRVHFLLALCKLLP
mmetsp:Transcript_36453/g.114268  ORF Transcript_36453/g.114268 Transcript_36453/m.114268 type:complete len:264 (+) Transcript_36453:1163-1954(+)